MKTVEKVIKYPWRWEERASVSLSEWLKVIKYTPWLLQYIPTYKQTLTAETSQRWPYCPLDTQENLLAWKEPKLLLAMLAGTSKWAYNVNSVLWCVLYTSSFKRRSSYSVRTWWGERALHGRDKPVSSGRMETKGKVEKVRVHCVCLQHTNTLTL